MKLSETQKKLLSERLKERGVGASSCHVCGRGPWVVSDAIFELREFQGGSLVIGGDARILPVVPMTCQYCGTTTFLNALHWGILTELDQKPAESGR